MIALSSRSFWVAKYEMPLKMIGRLGFRMVSRVLVNSFLVLKPLPVESLQKPSDSLFDTVDTLSKLCTYELLDAITRSRSEFGSERRTALLGSMQSQIIRVAVLFAEPWLPWIIRIGNGPEADMALNIKATVRMKSSSLPTFRKGRNTSIVCPGIGFGSSNIAGVLIKCAGDSELGITS